MAVGIDKVIKVAKDMGITSALSANPSLTLGQSNVTMLDMASAYAVIANGGVRIDPTPVLTITNSKGEVIVDNTTPDTSLSKTHREQVISPEVAHAATEVMKSVVNTSEGTGQKACLLYTSISKHLVDAAHQFGATYIAHGCTGKGNDQVRFEASILRLDPDIEIIAPVREWDRHTRSEEMEWAQAHGIEVPTTKKSPYSIDDNLWGRAIECGVLEDPWMEPPTDIYTMTVDPTEAPDEPQYVEPVSYTHLDVYKRQSACSCPWRRSGSACLRRRRCCLPAVARMRRAPS